MRIAIDARMMGPLSTRGIGRYSEELVRALLEVAPEHRYVLLTRQPEASPFIGHLSVEHRLADCPWYGVKEQLVMPRLLREARADIVHIPHWNVPLGFRGPLVTTIHDLLLMHQPASAKASLRHPILSRLKQVGFRLSLRHAVSSSKIICVPTEDVAKDIASHFRIPSERLLVTGEGVSTLPLPDTSRLPDAPFFLIVGSAYPHKRIDTALAAWRTLSELRPDTHLVVAGEEDGFMARHVAQVYQERLPRVHFLGRVSDAELSGLYTKATLLLFPSSFEGFGLPPLEALSFGTPVVATDIPVLRETCPKDGVWFFQVGDADGMIRAIDQALADGSSARSAAQRGWQEVRLRHTWRGAAERTLDAYVRARSSS